MFFLSHLGQGSIPCLRLLLIISGVVWSQPPTLPEFKSADFTLDRHFATRSAMNAACGFMVIAMRGVAAFGSWLIGIAPNLTSTCLACTATGNVSEVTSCWQDAAYRLPGHSNRQCGACAVVQMSSKRWAASYFESSLKVYVTLTCNEFDSYEKMIIYLFIFFRMNFKHPSKQANRSVGLLRKQRQTRHQKNCLQITCLAKTEVLLFNLGSMPSGP